MVLSFLYLAFRALLGALVRSRRGLHVKDIELHGIRAQKSGDVPTFVLRDVEEFRLTHSLQGVDKYVKRATRESF
jgi:hypothetical protein